MVSNPYFRLGVRDALLHALLFYWRLTTHRTQLKLSEPVIAAVGSFHPNL